MLVALPVCAKDASHVLANLDHAHRLEGRKQLQHQCFILHDTSFDATEITAKVREVFFQYARHAYEPWSGTSAWPAPQNHAWQSAARVIYSSGNDLPEFYRVPWLWWEADATPLCAGWLDQLRDAYAALPEGKVFLGPIASTVGGHMNGVSVYPWDTPAHCPRSMYTSHVPFDVALSSECLHEVEDASALIHHYPRWTGVRLRITDRRVSQALVAKGYVLHHGVNDGSLRTCLMGRKPERLVNAPPHTVHTLTLANYLTPPDEALSRWHIVAHARAQKGHPLIPFGECTRVYPSIVDQARALGMECGFFPLTPTPRVVHYNPGLIRHPDGHLYLLTRRWTRTQIGWHSDMLLHRVAPDLSIVTLRPLVLPRRTLSEQHEDPRLHIHNGHIYLSYCAWQPGSLYVARQRLSVLNLNWREEITHEIALGNNGRTTEKNWLPFRVDGRLHIWYSFDPHVIVEIHGQRDVTVHKVADPPRTWAWGEIRGGTTPVRVGDEFITFFHSSVPWRGRQNRYVAGAYAFSATPPFTPTRLVRTPLLVGTDLDSRVIGGPPCAFPGGAVHEDGKWLVTLGVNDECSAFLKVSDQRLNELLEPVV